MCGAAGWSDEWSLFHEVLISSPKTVTNFVKVYDNLFSCHSAPKMFGAWPGAGWDQTGRQEDVLCLAARTYEEFYGVGRSPRSKVGSLHPERERHGAQPRFRRSR